MRAILVALVLAFACLAAPGAVQAGLFSPDTAPGYGLQDELGELGRVREKIRHRQALRRTLDRETRTLALEIASLRARHERIRATLGRDRRVLAEVERNLDRIAPRLAARERAMHERRRQVARVLADIAALSRRDGLDPAIRVRMRAIGPALLDQLDATDVATATLERQHERAARTKGRLESRIPLLRAEAEQVEQQRRQKRARRLAALDKVAQLDVELKVLTEANARLGGLVLALRAAHALRVAPQPDQPASEPERFAPTSLQMGSIRGRAAATPPVARHAQARHRSEAHIAAASLKPSLAPMARLPRVTSFTNVGLKPPAMGAGWPMGVSRATLAPVARTVLAAMPVIGTSSRVARGGLPRLEPIRPSLDAVARRFHNGNDGIGVSLAAAPGQTVAAADGGRVVFADAFKSYGLLLIIEHDNEYHTLLWGFSRLRVDFGDEVHGGQIVGVMDVVDGSPPRLHVELRRNGRPVNPLPWLAGSSSKVRG